MVTAKGVCCSVQQDEDSRFFLFELDGDMSEIAQDIETVLLCYIKNDLDMLMHKTHRGYHFLSPTLITKGRWKTMYKELHHLNPDCPMITLRLTPNKYPNEDQIWYKSKALYNPNNEVKNSSAFCNLLNVAWGTSFVGTHTAEPKRVEYQL